MRKRCLCAFLIIGLLFPLIAYGKTKVVASIFPFYDFTREIVRERGHVHLLIRPGTDLHHFEPRPSDISTLKDADFFVYGGKEIEPWAEKIGKTVRSQPPYFINVSEGLVLKTTDGATKDPHVWLDFSYAERMVDNIVENLAQKDRGNAGFYRRNGETYKDKLRDLDRRYMKTLSSCRIRTIVHAGHYSFGYLAKRYDLDYVSAYPVGMESEPKPGQIAKMKETIRKNGARYVFYEEIVNPKVAKILSTELGVGMLRLNSGGNVSKRDFEKGVTFIQIMEDNLENLKRGLECTQ